MEESTEDADINSTMAADNELTHVRTKNLSGNVKLTTLEVLSTNTPLDKLINKEFENEQKDISDETTNEVVTSTGNKQDEIQTITENQHKVVLLSEDRTKASTDGVGPFGLMDVFNSTSGTLPDQASTEKVIAVTPLHFQLIHDSDLAETVGTAAAEKLVTGSTTQGIILDTSSEAKSENYTEEAVATEFDLIDGTEPSEDTTKLALSEVTPKEITTLTSFQLRDKQPETATLSTTNQPKRVEEPVDKTDTQSALFTRTTEIILDSTAVITNANALNETSTNFAIPEVTLSDISTRSNEITITHEEFSETQTSATPQPFILIASQIRDGVSDDDEVFTSTTSASKFQELSTDFATTKTWPLDLLAQQMQMSTVRNQNYGEAETSSTHQPSVTSTFRLGPSYQYEGTDSVYDDAFTVSSNGDKFDNKESVSVSTENIIIENFELEMNGLFNEPNRLVKENAASAVILTQIADSSGVVDASEELTQDHDDIEDLSSFINVDEEFLGTVLDENTNSRELEETIEDVSSILTRLEEGSNFRSTTENGLAKQEEVNDRLEFFERMNEITTVFDKIGTEASTVSEVEEYYTVSTYRYVAETTTEMTKVMESFTSKPTQQVEENLFSEKTDEFVENQDNTIDSTTVKISDYESTEMFMKENSTNDNSDKNELYYSKDNRKLSETAVHELELNEFYNLNEVDNEIKELDEDTMRMIEADKATSQVEEYETNYKNINEISVIITTENEGVATLDDREQPTEKNKGTRNFGGEGINQEFNEESGVFNNEDSISTTEIQTSFVNEDLENTDFLNEETTNNPNKLSVVKEEDHLDEGDSESGIIIESEGEVEKNVFRDNYEVYTTTIMLPTTKREIKNVRWEKQDEDINEEMETTATYFVGAENEFVVSTTERYDNEMNSNEADFTTVSTFSKDDKDLPESQQELNYEKFVTKTTINPERTETEVNSYEAVSTTPSPCFMDNTDSSNSQQELSSGKYPATTTNPETTDTDLKSYSATDNSVTSVNSVRKEFKMLSSHDFKNSEVKESHISTKIDDKNISFTIKIVYNVSKSTIL
jgi:hypothetical protein